MRTEFLLTLFIICKGSNVGNVLNDDPWDVDGPCQKFVENFAVAQANMVQCATNYSIPPRVCTNCFDRYIAFKQVEYETHHLTNVSSRDNRTCSEVIYNNYLVSYNYEISEALTNRIWDASRCESCIHISWNFTANSSDYDWNIQTYNFSTKLAEWRKCIVNYTESDSYDLLNDYRKPNVSICEYCKPQFNDLFAFYWHIYVAPEEQFCVDVETTMNDTLHIWNDIWKCAERRDRKRETALVVWTMALLLLFTGLFYMASYIQGGGTPRNIIRYSLMNRPQGQRSRLLSASASDNSLSTHIR